jgi:hypothetical protein
MERKKLVRTSIPTSTTLLPETAVQELNKKTIEQNSVKAEVKRINMDMPQDLYELIEAEVAETGQTIKGFFVMLSRQHFRTKGKL